MMSIHSLIEVRPLSFSDTLDVSGTYLKIIIEPNRIILKFRLLPYKFDKNTISIE